MSLFLKRFFFAVYVFFSPTFFLLYLFFWKWYFFRNGDVEEFVSETGNVEEFVSEMVFFVGNFFCCNFFLPHLIFVGIGNGTLVFFTVFFFFFAVGRGDADDSFRDFLV
jgi:hypothetical protein